MALVICGGRDPSVPTIMRHLGVEQPPLPDELKHDEH